VEVETRTPDPKVPQVEVGSTQMARGAAADCRRSEATVFGSP